MKKAMIAVMLCIGIIGCKQQTVEEEPSTDTTEMADNKVVSEIKNTIEELTEPAPVQIVEPAQITDTTAPSQGLTVDEDASYHFDEDTDYIID